MPRTRSLAFAELKLGLIAVLAIVLAGALIFAVGGGGFFWQQYPLKTTFANVAGIKSGSPVRIAGIEKGSVSRVEFAGTGVEVWFDQSELRGGDAWDSRSARSFGFRVLSLEFGNPQSEIRKK
jgi:ABC-type transporter Mla subunit MlaD